MTCGVSSISPPSVYHQVRMLTTGQWISHCLLARNIRVVEDAEGLRPCLRCEPDAPAQADPVVYFGEIRQFRRRPDLPNLIKVGTSRDLDRRMAHHASMTGYFRLLGTIPGGVDVEAQVHRELRPWAVGEEVFAKCDPVFALVNDYLTAATA